MQTCCARCSSSANSRACFSNSRGDGALASCNRGQHNWLAEHGDHRQPQTCWTPLVAHRDPRNGEGNDRDTVLTCKDERSPLWPEHCSCVRLHPGAFGEGQHAVASVEKRTERQVDSIEVWLVAIQRNGTPLVKDPPDEAVAEPLTLCHRARRDGVPRVRWPERRAGCRAMIGASRPTTAGPSMQRTASGTTTCSGPCCTARAAAIAFDATK